MAATVKNREIPTVRERIADVTLDASYPTGGYALKASDVGLSSIEHVLANPAAGYDFEWNSAAHKLVVYRVGASFSNPLAEVSAATNLSAVTVRVLIVGY